MFTMIHMRYVILNLDAKTTSALFAWCESCTLGMWGASHVWGELSKNVANCRTLPKGKIEQMLNNMLPGDFYLHYQNELDDSDL